MPPLAEGQLWSRNGFALQCQRNGLLSLSLSLSLSTRGVKSLLLAALLLVTQPGNAQETQSQQVGTDAQAQAQPEQKPTAEEKERDRKQQKPQSRATAMTASGDSAAGSIGGIASPEQVKVTSGGAASQAIPIVVPPGTAGVQPNLSFNYNSQGENSLLGVGWSVSGLPVIHRCPRTVAQDGFRGGVNYDNNDRFCLDGQRLMAISGSYGANLAEYRTEVDSFQKIISYGIAGNGPSYFKLWTKGGEVMEFGNTEDSKIQAQGKTSVRVWALNRVQDVKNNHLKVFYFEDSTNGEYRPDRIEYTFNTAAGMTTATRKVVFGYNENGVVRADQIPQWVGGSKILTTKLLTSVKTWAPPLGSSTPVLVRDYRLEYETGTATKRSRLKRIKECDGAGNCLPLKTPGSQPAWQFTWQEGGDGSYQYLPGTAVSFGVNFFNTKVRTGDFNGDGKSDFVTLGGGKIWTYLSNGNGTFTQFNTAFQGYQMDTDYFWIGDIDGDGLDDLITQNSGTTIYTYKSTGSGTFTLLSSQSVSTNQFNKLQTWAGDFNGDGRTDLLSLKSLKFYTFLSNGNGSYQVTAGFTLVSSQIDVANLWTGDFNGDGKVDVVSATGAYLRTYLAVGDGTFQLVSFNRSGLGPVLSGLQTKAADFNGDGRTDLVSMSYDGQFYQFFSKGDGNYDYIYYLPPVPTLYTWDNYPRVGDFNGDGKMDILTCRYDATDGNCAGYLPGVQGYLVTLLSKGNGDFTVVEQPTSASVPLYYDWAVWEGDFSGDGKTEVLHQSTTSVKTYNPIGPYPDLLTNITNPFGGTSAITYKPLTDGTVYAKDGGAQAAVYPNVDSQNPTYVVSNLSISNGLVSTYAKSYSYGGAKAHHLGRGNLGFRWMTEVDVSANSKTSTFYNQTFPLTGLPNTVETDRNSDGAPFRETQHEYWDLNHYTTVPTLRFVAPKKVDILEQDGSTTLVRTIRREFSYDSAQFGNLVSTYHHGDIAVSGDEREETTDWVVDAANWLHKSKTLKLKDGSGNVVREKWLYYDNQAHGVLGTSGLVTKEENNAGGGIGHVDNPVFLYTNDSATGVRTIARDPRLCDTTTTYESTKTFPQSVAVCSNIAALNLITSYVYDPRHGVVTSVTEPYGVGDSPLPTTTNTYDGFGRLTKTTGPLDTASTYGTETRSYSNWGDPALQRVVTSRTENHGTANVLVTEEYFDGLGRIDKIRRDAPDTSTSGKTIVTDMTFDSRNLTLQRSAPYFINSSGSPLETPKYDLFAYDPLGRATLVTHPDSTYATKLYQRGVVTLTDERGKSTKRYFDGLEQLTKVQEFNSASTYDTLYARDAAGSLKTLTNALGHLTKIDYDMLGRKRAMCDPNMGTPTNVASCTTGTTGAWVYTYNQAGDLLTQKDAKNQTLTFTYDELGRPKTKKQGTTTIASWTYDNPAVMFSKGRVTQVVDYPATQNTTTNFTYDVLGRVTQSQRILMGVTYNMTQSYDALGRIKTETFPAPDNETVTYNYNEAGWLKSVTNYINDIQYDARGQKTQLTYANGLISSWTYDANRFWETNRTTSASQQNLTYGRDNNGNITSITDNLGGTAGRTFQYDDLNRLTYAQGNFGANQSAKTCNYSFNAIGNLLDKCGAVLSYNHAMHPSAVSNNSLTGKSYSYDANGNMTARGTQTLAWDIENRVTSVSISGGGSTLMEYDFTGMRVKKNAPTGITLYPFKGYEIDPSNTVTKFIRIGNESFASKKRTSGGTTTQYFYHNDHLGSVNVITNIGGSRVQRNEYEPWGEVSRSEGATPGSPVTVDLNHRFTGQELDPETGLHYYGGRYYDQEIGRFASPDPYVQAPDNPQNLNRYTYVLNNPQYYVDPSGHFVFEILGAILLGAAISAEVIAPTVTITTIMEVVSVVNSFMSTIQIAMKYGSNTELKQLSQQRGADQGANSEKPKPQGDRALSKVNPSGDIPGQGQEWWNFNFCGFIFACDAQAADDDTGRMPPGGFRRAPFGANTKGSGPVSKGGSNSTSDGGALDAKNTTHGEQRLRERGWTQAEIAAAKSSGIVKTQADGAKVFINEVSPGKFNVIVEGNRGIITGMKNLDLRALNNLATNYGWK